MGNNFICPRCGNQDPKYVGYLNGKPYCRFCITMKGKQADKKKKILWIGCFEAGLLAVKESKEIIRTNCG